MPSQSRFELDEAMKHLISRIAEGEPTIAEQRAAYDEFGDRTPPPEGTVVEQNIWRGVSVPVVDATSGSATTVVFYLHGGGYVIGSYRSHAGFAGHLSRVANVRIALPQYRLAPEHPFPAAVEDATAAYLGMLDSGILPEQVVFSGDSAGGGLALAALLALRDRGAPLPAAATLLSPWTDLSFTGETLVSNREIDTMVPLDMIRLMARRYRPEHEQKNPLVSPVYADLAGLPPLQIHVGTDEILLDDSRRIAANAEAAGVPCDLRVWPGMTHVFPTFAPLLSESNDAWIAQREMGDFATAHAK